MAWRIHDQVIRAVIDNRIPGKVTGSVWLTGRDQPLQLDLKGNAGADMAGCLLTVENHMTVPDPLEGLATEQCGVCGDMTASRKVRIPTVPLMEWLDAHQGEPFHYVWGNGIYLEWYSERNGRVVIELSGRNSTLSEPVWRLTPDQEADQRRESAEAFGSFMGRLTEAARSSQPKVANADNASGTVAVDKPSTPAEMEQRARIDALKRQVREVVGEEILCGTGHGLSLDAQERFWQNVLQFEQSEVRQVRDLLAQDGIQPPDPDLLTDTQLAQQLSVLIQGLAKYRIFLQFTNHLSDRELYALLCRHVLEDEIETPGSDWNTHVDLSITGLAEDDDGSDTYLRYYADPLTREQWANDIPKESLPTHEDPPYNRDETLPQP